MRTRRRCRGSCLCSEAVFHLVTTRSPMQHWQTDTVREPLIQRSRDLFLPSDSLRHLSHQLLTFEVGSNGAVSFSWLKRCFCLRQFTTSNDTILQKNTKKLCFSYFYLIFAKVSSIYKKICFVHLLKTHLINVFKTHKFNKYFMFKRFC